jgi:hypothetical protein
MIASSNVLKLDPNERIPTLLRLKADINWLQEFWAAALYK